MKYVIFLIVMTATCLAWADNKPKPVYVSWDSHMQGRETECPCSEGSSVNPYSGGVQDCKRPTGCHVDLVKAMVRVFPNQEEADKFKVGCSTTACSNWNIREATLDETVDQFMADNHWVFGVIPNPSEYCVREQFGVKVINGVHCLGYGKTRFEAVQTAAIFQDNHWRLLMLSLNDWGVFADPNNDIQNMPMGNVTDGHGTSLSPIASSHDPYSAVKHALKIAGIK